MRQFLAGALMHAPKEIAHPADADSFARNGFSGPIALLTPSQCALALRHFQRVKKIQHAPWHKALGAHDRLFFEFATRPHILKLLRPILGNDIVLWGVSIVQRDIGKVHPWHCDIESSMGEGFVSLWIGLKNTNRESALTVISRSHLFEKTIQQVRTEKSAARNSVDDVTATEWAKEIDPAASLIQSDVSDGDGILFDGRLWHATNNMRATGKRSAFLIQYAAADTAVRLPDFSTLDWPFRFLEERPPVVVVSGRAPSNGNNLVPPPATAPLPRLTIETKHLKLPLAEHKAKGWVPYQIRRGKTPNAERMSVHASVLSPGNSPHSPHAHLEEEILFIIDGEAEILLGEDPKKMEVHSVGPQQLFYYPPYHFHTIRNVSKNPVTYMMFKWSGTPLETRASLRPEIINFRDMLAKGDPAKRKSKAIVERQTCFLKRLRVHLTSLPPKAGYEPHADKHDVAIFVLSGKIKSVRKTMRRGGFYYFSAGEMHGMKNVGSSHARYIVFEFHAPAPDYGNRREVLGLKLRSLRTKAGRLRIVRQLRWLGRKLRHPIRSAVDPLVDRRVKMQLGMDLQEVGRLLRYVKNEKQRQKKG